MPGIVMTEDVTCHTSTWKLEFVIFIFENKFIIFDTWIFFTCTFLPCVCGSDKTMWFNLNSQFWLQASSKAQIEQGHSIIGARVIAQV